MDHVLAVGEVIEKASHLGNSSPQCSQCSFHAVIRTILRQIVTNGLRGPEKMRRPLTEAAYRSFGWRSTDWFVSSSASELSRICLWLSSVTSWVSFIRQSMRDRISNLHECTDKEERS